ncbi:MAG: hypothetical protein ACOYBY_08100 [Dermatophilaceae bacterium]
MKLYSDYTGRRTAQVVTDILVLAWVSIWAYAGRATHDATLALRAPADQLRENGDTLNQSMTSAADAVQGVPLVGEEITAAFDEAARAGMSVSDVGTNLGVAVERVSLVLGLTIALVPIVVVVAIWAVARIRFARRATAAKRFVDAQADLDLFALRAMARQPMATLARVSDDPAGAWRRRDPDVVRALAVLELRRYGLRLPSEPR